MPNGHRIIDPHRPQIGVQHMPMPISNAVPFSVNTPAGGQLIIAGGIHPLVTLAAQIAAGIVAHVGLPEDPAYLARHAAALAEAVNDAVAERLGQASEAQEPDSPA